MIAVALYQPDIPQNVGAAMRLCACLAVELHIIEPYGFPWDERKIRQAGMDYIEFSKYRRFESWEAYLKEMAGRRLVLMTTKSSEPYTGFTFQKDDILVAGRESAGVPENVHTRADARVCIPMIKGPRSLNIVTATAMILGEAIRQTGPAIHNA